MEVILKCLDQFAVCSGQRVKKDKTQINFSSNVEDKVAKDIATRAGFQLTKDLERYLVVPSIHGRIKKTPTSHRCWKKSIKG